jgi:hypothetical protein
MGCHHTRLIKLVEATSIDMRILRGNYTTATQAYISTHSAWGKT